ncbi:protein ROLLING AND ERECT LEAF 2 isoform X2 [Diospyros lotus]|uniref:protein ROLLING AND ERECT LEAF 2 isoform X2 n=1 Tax=Diospyros lotus TaxID=55363 RepID=UPI00224FC0C6|nr:protein ROLLING AND ERECT LEAF 2 isoform X2 [Diospyros lotus]
MGCGGSKVDDLPLVVRCRERKELIRAAADQRYALAYAHLAYFASLPAVGDALRRFVDEELVVAASSPFASPVLTLPSNEGKKKKNNRKTGNAQTRNDLAISSSSTSLSHSGSGSHIHLSDHDGDDGSHLHLPSDSDSELDSSGHIHLHDSPDNAEIERPSYSSPPPIQTDWGPYGMNQPAEANWGPYGYGVHPPHQPGWDPAYGMDSTSYTYYMQRSSPQVQSVIYDPSKSVAAAETSYSYSSYQYDSGSGGFFGFPMRSPAPPQNQQPSSPAGPPPPPSPKVSAWDFLNPFDGYDSGYPGYYSYGRYGYGSMASSPDSNEVREREGIPDLEDETESEAYREVHKGKNSSKVEMKGKGNSGEGSSKSKTLQSHGIGSSEGSPMTVPSHGSSEGSSRGIPSEISGKTSREEPSQNGEATHSVEVKVEKSSPDSGVSKGTEDGSLRKKGVTFEVDVGSGHDAESSKLSSLTTLSADITRDLQEVVAEIRDEFATASSYGKEVAMLLEVGKLPYQPRSNLLNVILSRILYMVAPSSSSSRPSSRKSVRFAFSTMKLAKSYFGDSGKNPNMKPSNLSSTLEKLYVWEKKLYKEVKDEERLRIIYEKQCKRLKILDDQGAESSKIDATQASIRKLLTKLDVCIKAVDAISNRIHKLRDEELQPQVTELIYGLIGMWKTMLKCHQKQFQAIMASKTQSLRANTSSRRDSSLRATVELEMQLLTWCSRFSDWINTQRPDRGSSNFCHLSRLVPGHGNYHRNRSS